MKNILIALISLLLSASCSQDANGLKAIHVEGNRFVDDKGNTVVFKGLCLADPVKLYNEGQWTERIFAEAENWGSNVVRFAVHPSFINNCGWEKTFGLIDQGIEWAKSHNQYVIIDWHSIGSLCEEKFQAKSYITTIEETFRFWKTAAAKYKDEPAHNPVIADDTYGEEITKYLESKGISFTVWCFDPQWAPMLIKDWNYTPTTQGRFFKAYLSGKASDKCL